MSLTRHLYIAIAILLFSGSTWSASFTLPFESFLSSYLSKSSEILSARRQLYSARENRVAARDQWQSRLTATPQLSFETQKFDSSLRDDNSNRTTNITGQLVQGTPTGTEIQVNAQKYLETQNPLFSTLDRSYSAKITQDLFRNAFGATQRSIRKKAKIDFNVAELEYRQSMVNTCENAFTLYAETYIQQEITELLISQLKDAKRALRVSKDLYRDRLINKIDKLTSENDFIDTELQVEQAKQKLLNSKLQIQAFLEDQQSLEYRLKDPSYYVLNKEMNLDNETISEIILQKRVNSQELDVDRARWDRRTDVKLGFEVGERFGRLAFNGPLLNYNEEYLRASVEFGFDLINNTEDADLKNAIDQKNSLSKETQVLAKTQRSKVAGLVALNDLLKSQVAASQNQVKILEEKMDIAFKRMERAQMDFQNYLLHRNAYLNQKRNYLQLKKDLWLNQFAIQKEFAHNMPKLCEAPVAQKST